MDNLASRISRSKWIVVPVVLLLLLVGVQRELIDPTPEKTEEDRFSDFSNLPVSSALPAYIGSLFLGAFRAIAVDILWMEYSEANSKQLYHEQKQLVELLTHLQPRNEETWCYLGWDLAYNLAGMAPTPEEKWRYIREGLDRLMEGARINTNSVKILFDIASTLSFKATWQEGVFQHGYLESYAGDREFQRRLLGRDPDSTLPFEASRHWFLKAREKIRELSRKKGIEGARLSHTVSASGLALTDSTMDISIIETEYYEAMFHWHRGEYDKAAAPLERAIRGIDDLLRTYGDDAISSLLFRKKKALFTAILDAIPLVRENMRTPSPRALIEILGILEPAYLANAKTDGGYVYGWLSTVKQRAGGDVHEINDDLFSCRVLEPRRPIGRCTIAPTPGDVDVFAVRIDDGLEETEQYRPVAVRVAISGVKDLPIRIAVLPIGDAFRRNVPPVHEMTTAGDRETETVVFTAAKETHYLITITSADPNRWLPDRVYAVELLEKPR